MLLENFLSTVTRSLVDSQCSLDQIGRESLINFEENAIPPTVWKWSELKLSLPMFFQQVPKNNIHEKTSLSVALAKNSSCNFSIHIKYLEKSQDEEEA